MQRQVCPAPAKPDDTRDTIAKKLLEKCVINGEVYSKCIMQLVEYAGHVSCVVCKRVEKSASAK